MILTPGVLAPPAARLLARVVNEGGLGEQVARFDARGELAPGMPVTVAIADGEFVLDVRAMLATLTGHPVRILVLSRLGAHPDARHRGLQRLWRLEESARAIAAPVLTLRFAPLVGRGSPLWFRLRSRPSLPAPLARRLVQPVAEDDALETLVRALSGRVRWESWWEVAGEQAFALGELIALAVASGPLLNPGTGAWEPALEELSEHRLAESEPWARHFGLAPTPVATRAAAWAA